MVSHLRARDTHTGDQFNPFGAAMADVPGDGKVLLVSADWFDENGRPNHHRKLGAEASSDAP